MTEERLQRRMGDAPWSAVLFLLLGAGVGIPLRMTGVSLPPGWGWVGVPVIGLVLGLLALGGRGWWRAMGGVGRLWRGELPAAADLPVVERFLGIASRHLLLAGFLTTLLELIRLLTALGGPEEVWAALGVVLMPLLVALALLLFLLWPTRLRWRSLATGGAGPPLPVRVPLVWGMVCLLALGTTAWWESGESLALLRPPPPHPRERAGGWDLPVLLLEPLVVNLADSTPERPLFLKLGLALELADWEERTRSELGGRREQVRDLLLTRLITHRSAELGSVEGKFRLREEILAVVNALLERKAVNRVYFREFVIHSRP